MSRVNATVTATTTPPVPEAVLERARAAVRRYHLECFWFWRIDAPIRSADDVRSVIEHLRGYGDRGAWRVAQEIQRCL